jgi:hypothetical protein
LKPAFLVGVNILSVVKVDRIAEYQVNALSFLAAFYSIEEKVAREVDNERLIVAISSWFRDFPCHTIAMEAVCHFMEVVIVIPGLGEYVNREFLPLVLSAETTPNNRIPLSFAVQWVRQIALMSTMSKAAARLIAHPEIRRFCRGRVAEVDLILSNEYGSNTATDAVALALCPALDFASPAIDV